MFRISNTILGLINIITLIISIPIIGWSLWSSINSATACDRYFQLPLLVVGLLMLVVSLLGLLGSCCRITFFLWVYLFVMFFLIIGLFCFTVFAFVITNKSVAEVISDKGYKEYKFGDYTHWLQNRIGNKENWERIKSCLNEIQVCRSLGKDFNPKAAQFYKMSMLLIQSGCCKPPLYCGFSPKNETFWTAPKSGAASSDEDCDVWKNDQSQLCYDCKSCKVGVLANLMKEWRKVALVNIAILIFITILYSIGCCAFRNNRSDNSYGRYRKGAYR